MVRSMAKPQSGEELTDASAGAANCTSPARTALAFIRSQTWPRAGGHSTRKMTSLAPESKKPVSASTSYYEKTGEEQRAARHRKLAEPG